MTQYPPPPKRKVWPWLAGLAVLIVLALCGGVIAVSTKIPPQVQTTVTTPPQPVRATAAPAAPKTPRGIEDGEWLVGKDIGAGTYRTAGAADSSIPLCNWVVWTSDDKADAKTSGLSTKPNQPGRVVLKQGQVFTTSGCKVWVKQP